MMTYHYKAATTNGEVVKGELRAATREKVVEQLQALGHVPIRVEEAVAEKAGRRPLRLRRRRVSEQQVADMTRELGTLLQAGLPLDRALAVLASLSGDSALRTLLEDVRSRVKEGATLADAMAAHGTVFGRFYLGLLRAGESSGALDVVFERLADHLERSREMRSAVISALMYPAILVVVAVVAVAILLGYVVPQFTQMFADFNQALPLSTRLTIAAGNFVKAWGWLAALLALAVLLLLRRQLADPGTARSWHGRILRVPVLGDILVKIEVARFARTLATLLKNGVPLLEALTIVKASLGNRALAEALESVAGGLRDGRNLAEPLAETQMFPAFAVHMIRVGEESGELHSILDKVAAAYERDSEVAIKRSLTLLEPLLILFLGVMIAGVIVSILAAIMSINELVI